MPVNEGAQRTILPKTKHQYGMDSLSPTDDHLNGYDGSTTKLSRSTTQARSNIRSACLACRQRRSKCTGGAPCNRCESLNTDCVYDEGHDRRTRAIRERGREELELHRKVLDGVFDAIRHDKQSHILNLVRGNASLSTIASAIDGQYEQETNGDSMEDHNDGDQTAMDSDMHMTSDSNLIIQHTIQSTAQDLVSSAEYSSPEIARESFGHFEQQTAHTESSQSSNFRFMDQPLHLPPSVMLDQMSRHYLEFRNFGASLAGHEALHYNLIGTPVIRCELMFRHRLPSDPYDVYTWASAVANQYPELDVFFRLAWLVLLVRFMRWCIELTHSSFEALPGIMRPTSLQKTISHMPYIDLAPLPQLRDAIIRNPRDFCASIRVSGVSVGWSKPLEHAVKHDLLNGGLVVSEEFVLHASNEANYTFGRAMLQDFPEMKLHVTASDQHFIAPTPFLSPLEHAALID